MGIDLVTRAEWGARAPRGSYSPLTRTNGVKVHFTGSRVEPTILDDHDLCVELVKSIQHFHMDGNGWMDIGYSLCCCPHRKVFVGRGPGHLPAANGPGLNSGHYAVLGLVGNSGLVEPPEEMLLGILDAVEYLHEHGGAGWEIKGHRDGYSTDCPGDALYAWVRQGAPRPRVRLHQTGTPPPWPGRYLRYPPLTRGDDVRTWQRAAVEVHCLHIAVDGAYGPDSREACQRIQRAAGLDVDGVVGPRTWAATVDSWPAPPCPSTAST